jgi:hypothetical protein
MGRRFAVLGFVMGVVVSLAPSCGPTRCGAATCPSGCCDPSGLCKPGTDQAVCGKGGATCQVCAATTTCSAQRCMSPLGAGGGAGSAGGTGGSSLAGGSAASGGGSAGGNGGGAAGVGGGSAGGAAPGDAGITCAARFNALAPANPIAGGYLLAADGGVGVHFVGLNLTITGGAFPRGTIDARLVNQDPATPVVLPFTGTFEALTPTDVVVPSSSFSLGCDAAFMNCGADYVAVQGGFSITSATDDPAMGTFVGSYTTVRYDRFDRASSRLIVDGGCIELQAFTFSAFWPRDAGP